VLTRLRLLLRSLFLRRRLEEEMREELDAHLGRARERLTRRGMDPESARRAALREFGNRGYFEEAARDARGGRWLEATLGDLRFGLRHLARTPVSTATMIVMLALGIGCNTALYAVLYSITTMPPPGVDRDESLVRIRGSAPTSVTFTIGREFPYAEYRAYAAQNDLFRSVAAWTSADVVLAPGDQPDELVSGAATYVTAEYFRILGVSPALGRDPMEGAGPDDGPPHLAGVISYPVWDRLFGRDTAVLGKRLVVNDVGVTVVGVAPREFVGTRPGGSVMRVWLPLNTRPTVQRASAPLLATLDSALYGMAARLQPGVDAAAATTAVKAIAERAVAANPLGVPRSSADVVPLRAGNYFPPSGDAPPSLVSRLPMLLVPLVILLIPCINVSSLLAGMAAGRSREIAVRLSLGAPRRRIVRQLVTEAVLLAVAASVLGLIVIRVLRELFASRFPDTPLVLHPSAALVAFGVAIFTGIVFGISPALHATRIGQGDALKRASGTVAPARSRLQAALVTLQVAVTQPLLLGMGALLLMTLGEIRNLPVAPFNDRIVRLAFSTVRAGERGQQIVVVPPGSTLPRDTATSREVKLARVAARVAEIPGVVAVVPQERSEGAVLVSVRERDEVPGNTPRGSFWLSTQPAPAGFFDLMGYSFVQGRAFEPADAEEGRALVIGSDLARRLWGDADPVGRRLVRLGGDAIASELVIVGVIDVATARGNQTGGAQVFVPTLDETASLLVRTQTPSEPLLPAIRRVANEEAPEYPITSARTLAAAEADRRATFRNLVYGAAGVGALALLLSAIGLYAVVTFAVSQRMREIGVRTAFGANVQQIVSMFFLRGLKLCAIGVGIGLLLSVAVVKLIALAEGRPDEQRTGWAALLVTLVVLVVASLASWIPARRAACVDPLTVLREE
jgi:predicted permease